MKNGECECPKGTTLQGLVYKKKSTCQGGRIVMGKCICPNGQKLQNGVWKKYTRCPVGYVLKNGKCVRIL